MMPRIGFATTSALRNALGACEDHEQRSGAYYYIAFRDENEIKPKRLYI
jgi:hypothetical protein